MEKINLDDFSILIGGKAGFGIDNSSLVIAHLLNESGYFIHVYRDYPSLIRGGHTFSIIRASKKKISAFGNKIDFLLSLNKETLDLHRMRLKEGSVIIYDSKIEATKGIPIDLEKIIKEEKAHEIMRNSILIGALCKNLGIEWDSLVKVFQKHLSKELDLNLKVAKRGYDEMAVNYKIIASDLRRPLLTGNEALGLGLLNAGLEAYLAYPMTPSSTILHFLAEIAPDFNLQVIHPESEIAVMLMGLGFSYMGKKVAVGTSGGGFCLMTEGLSFSAMAELPITIIMGQRTGPSTGLPTYTAQADLNFVLHAGHGEFLRLIVAPGDAEEAYYWAGLALNLSCKYQIPSIILTDKTLAEGAFSFEKEDLEIKDETFKWDGTGVYKRYSNSENGVSPLAVPPEKGAVIKASSYEHDEAGITTEDPKITKSMQEKRFKKEKYLIEDLKKLKTVNVLGDLKSSKAILCFGSNKGVCAEVGEKLKMRVIQPLVINPFPKEALLEAFKGVKKVFCVENNIKGQLADLFTFHGFEIDKRILKYDGRPFTLDELEEKLGDKL